MSDERIHRAISRDGTEIAGRVYGHGPPLVLVHGAVADGLSEWGPILPWLTDHYTCYLPDMRSRGLSGASDDLSRETRVRDVVAYVESIGEPVTLVGVSGGGLLVLGAAARTSAVRAVVAREPVAYEALADDIRERFSDAVEQMSAAVARGEGTDSVTPFLEIIANDDEFAAISGDQEALEEIASFLPLDLVEFRECLAFRGPSPTAPDQLQRITVPVLLLMGAETGSQWFRDSITYAAGHIPDARVHEIPGVGHIGHLVEPEQDARELLEQLGKLSVPVA